jgi:hypothetical protein
MKEIVLCSSSNVGSNWTIDVAVQVMPEVPIPASFEQACGSDAYQSVVGSELMQMVCEKCFFNSTDTAGNMCPGAESDAQVNARSGLAMTFTRTVLIPPTIPPRKQEKPSIFDKVAPWMVIAGCGGFALLAIIFLVFCWCCRRRVDEDVAYYGRNRSYWVETISSKRKGRGSYSLAGSGISGQGSVHEQRVTDLLERPSHGCAHGETEDYRNSENLSVDLASDSFLPSVPGEASPSEAHSLREKSGRSGAGTSIAGSEKGASRDPEKQMQRRTSIRCATQRSARRKELKFNVDVSSSEEER